MTSDPSGLCHSVALSSGGSGGQAPQIRNPRSARPLLAGFGVWSYNRPAVRRDRMAGAPGNHLAILARYRIAVVRGGSFKQWLFLSNGQEKLRQFRRNCPTTVRCAARNTLRDNPNNRNRNNGFRVVVAHSSHVAPALGSPRACRKCRPATASSRASSKGLATEASQMRESAGVTGLPVTRSLAAAVGLQPRGSGEYKIAPALGFVPGPGHLP